MRCLDGITNSMDMSLSGAGSLLCTGRPGVVHWAAKSRTRLSS